MFDVAEVGGVMLQPGAVALHGAEASVGAHA
jgi:hypothetical protein